jgi:hypothetical protein
MSARAANRWNARPVAVAVALPYPAAMEFTQMREKLSVVRDTLVVLGMQVAFRVTMLLRHLNF